eukprot:gene11032-14813_t
MEDPLTLLPAKCSKCKTEVLHLTLERQLNDVQRQAYLSYISMKELQEDEKMANCPFCSYFEVWPKAMTGMEFLFCRNEPCLKSSCFHCKVQCQPPKEDGYEDDEFNNSTDSSAFIYHLECAELSPYKEEIENAIHLGAGVVCPNCQHFGRKDDACTHMTCVSCTSVFCYVCGKLEANCDKADPSQNIFSHNEDWDLNVQRCPMHLTEIVQVDDRWGMEDSICVAFLSRLNTVKLLRAALVKMGRPMFQRLINKYDSVRNCGYNEDDIMNTDITVIYRQEIED